jgi:hypothetical protein
VKVGDLLQTEETVARPLPKAVIHINFLPETLLFEPRRVWTALMRAEAKGTVSSGATQKIQGDFGQTAICLAQRDYVLRMAVNVLRDSLSSLADRIPDPWTIPEVESGGIPYRVVSGKEVFQDREKALLAVDSLLFEFRAYLELLAQFVFGVLKGAGFAPPPQKKIASGKKLTIVTKKGKLNAHNFLLDLCNKLSLDTGWYEFLVEHRNFFTHEGAPYIAIEDRMIRPPEFEFIIMRANIRDFFKASPEDYFRLSEFANVVQGLKELSAKAQEHLVGLLER